MGHKKVGVPSRRYTNEFKIEAVKLGQSVGHSESEPQAWDTGFEFI